MFHLRLVDRALLFGLAAEVIVGAMFSPRKMAAGRFARSVMLRVALVLFVDRLRRGMKQLEREASEYAHRVLAERLDEIRSEPYARHVEPLTGRLWGLSRTSASEATVVDGPSGERYMVRVTRQWAKRFRGPIQIEVMVMEFEGDLMTGLLTERVLVAPAGHRGA